MPIPRVRASYSDHNPRHSSAQWTSTANARGPRKQGALHRHWPSGNRQLLFNCQPLSVERIAGGGPNSQAVNGRDTCYRSHFKSVRRVFFPFLFRSIRGHLPSPDLRSTDGGWRMTAVGSGPRWSTGKPRLLPGAGRRALIHQYFHGASQMPGSSILALVPCMARRRLPHF